MAMAVRLQSARCLANVASCTSERTRAVVDAGAVPLLLSLISPQSTESDDADTVRLCDECVWALGNICADGPALRDVCMSEGLPVKFFELLAHVNARGEKAHVLGITSTRILLWASSCMLRGAPSLGQAHSHHLLRLVRAVGGLIWLHDEEVKCSWNRRYATRREFMRPCFLSCRLAPTSWVASVVWPRSILKVPERLLALLISLSWWRCCAMWKVTRETAHLLFGCSANLSCLMTQLPRCVGFCLS